MVRLLIEKGYAFQAYETKRLDDTFAPTIPLIGAVYGGNLNVVDLLIKNGADVNRAEAWELPDGTEFIGTNPLRKAAFLGNNLRLASRRRRLALMARTNFEINFFFRRIGNLKASSG